MTRGQSDGAEVLTDCGPNDWRQRDRGTKWLGDKMTGYKVTREQNYRDKEKTLIVVAVCQKKNCDSVTGWTQTPYVFLTFCGFLSFGGGISLILLIACSGGSLKKGGSPSTISMIMIPK
jgi:hypothetical protein